MVTTTPQRAARPIAVPDGGPVVIGVDTHKAAHHAAALTITGRLVADHGFPATLEGYRALADWAAGLGAVEGFGIELTGSYGAGLTRFLQAEGAVVSEVNTTDKATRARRGKDDRTDAIAAAQKMLAGMATSIPKDTTGAVEAIRVVLLARSSAVTDRTRAINQIKDVLVTAPAPLRETVSGLRGIRTRLAAIHALDPAGLAITDPTRAAIVALRRLATRIEHLETEIHDADHDLTDLVTPLAPTLLAEPNVGTLTAAQLLITAAQNIDRLHSEAAFARLVGVAPIPVSSGQTDRMRLHRGGDRQANRAIHMIVIGRLGTDPATRAYLARRTDPRLPARDRLSKRDTIRILKRYATRHLYRALKTDLTGP